MKTTESFKELQHKSTKRLAVWTMIWVLSTALATFGPELYMGEFPFHLRRRSFVFNHRRCHDFGQ